jgi:voltage-gated potassium channel
MICSPVSARPRAAKGTARNPVIVFSLFARIFGRDHRKHIAWLLAVAAGCVFGGGALFSATQGLPFSTGLYWAITTATTVGYGDVTPHNGAGRVVAIAVMLTTIPLLASVFALMTGGIVVAGVRRVLAMHARFPASPYRLVLGMNQRVHAVLDELVKAGVSVVLVADVDPAGLPVGVHLVKGDPTQPHSIRAARPQDAEQALVTGDSDGDVLVSTVHLRRLAPDVAIVALVGSPAVREALAELGVQQTISADELIAGTLAKSLEAPHAGDMLAQLVESNRHRLAEVPAETLAAVGKPLSGVRDERDELVLGLVHDGKFSLGVADDPTVESGDHLLIAERCAEDGKSGRAGPPRHRDPAALAEPTGASAAGRDGR